MFRVLAGSPFPTKKSSHFRNGPVNVQEGYSLQKMLEDSFVSFWIAAKMNAFIDLCEADNTPGIMLRSMGVGCVIQGLTPLRCLRI
jgi:hypothetical protein